MKASPKLQLVMAPTEPTRESVVDEFYKLDAQVKLFAPTLNRHKHLRETILSWFPNLPGDQGSSISGNEGMVMIGLAEIERKPASMVKICKLFGRDQFFARCSITIKAMEEVLGEDVAASLLVSKRTGSRKVTAIPKISPAEPAKAA